LCRGYFSATGADIAGSRQAQEKPQQLFLRLSEVRHVRARFRSATDSVATLAHRIAGLIAAGETMIEVPGGKERAAGLRTLRR
jgi:hypothetical protein